MELARRCNELDQQLYDYALSELYLPALHQWADRIADTRVYADQFTRKQRLLYATSVRYNNFIYRPLIKILYP
jgi:hypothetical protein